MHSFDKIRSSAVKKKVFRHQPKPSVIKTKITKTCKLCHTKQGNISGHISRVHKTDKHFLEKEITDADLEYGCDLCGARFVSKNSRYWHKLQHSLETKCFYCDFVADNLKGFQKHCLEVHGKQDEDMGDDKVKCLMFAYILIMHII